MRVDERSLSGADTPPRRPRPTTVSVGARGEQFNLVQVRGCLIVCAREHGACCCGAGEKGRLAFAPSLWGDEWERRKVRNAVYLTFSGCLGPCSAGNIAFLQIYGRSIWFKDLNDAALVPAVFDYIEQMIGAGCALPLPPGLVGHTFERFAGAGACDATALPVE
jgi:cobaltochelatase CobN